MCPLVKDPCFVKSQLTWSTEEQLKMNDCYYDNKDWRICKKEVSTSVLDTNS